MLHYLLLAVTLLSSPSEDSLLSKWKVQAIPVDHKRLNEYKYALCFVYLRNNEVCTSDTFNQKSDVLPFKIIEQEKLEKIRIPSHLIVHAVEDGFLVCVNSGEWGSSFYWYGKDGESKYLISHAAIGKFITRNNKLYAIQGLAHLGSNHGSIIEITRLNNKWETREYLKLPFAPGVVALDSKNNFIVATHGALVSVDTKAQLTTLVGAPPLEWYFCPNTMVLKDDVVYVGMRTGVLKYDLSAVKTEWLVPGNQ